MASLVVGMTFLVQRRSRSGWRTVHTAANDETAAHLAKALVAQAPMDPVRITLRTSGADGGEQDQVVWEYDARAFLPPGIRDDQDAALGIGQVIAAEGMFRGPELPNQKREISAKKQSLTTLTIAVSVAVVVLAAASMFSGVAPPDRLNPRQEEQGADETLDEEPTDEQISYLQSFIVRRYAYMTCIHENLSWGVQVARDAFREGRLTGDLLRLYEEQYRDVAREFIQGRRQLASLPADQGGLSLALMGFIDEWFRLNREILWRGRVIEDVVNPESFCKREADEGNFIQAFEASR